MVNFLFGWLLKPQIQVSALDGFIGIIEILLLFGIIIPCVIYAYIYLKNKIKNRKGNKNESKVNE